MIREAHNNLIYEIDFKDHYKKVKVDTGYTLETITEAILKYEEEAVYLDKELILDNYLPDKLRIANTTQLVFDDTKVYDLQKHLVGITCVCRVRYQDVIVRQTSYSVTTTDETIGREKSFTGALYRMVLPHRLTFRRLFIQREGKKYEVPSFLLQSIVGYKKEVT